MNGKSAKRVISFVKKNIALILIFALLIASLLSFLDSGKAFWQSLYTRFDIKGISSLSDEYPLNIYFLDVGKADSMLIECEGEYALVDAGTYANGDSVCTNLKKLGVEEIKLLVATHPDKDHIGGMAQVINTFSVDTLLQSDIAENVLPDSEEYNFFITAAIKKNLDQNYAQIGDVYTIGNAKLTIIAPVSSYDDTNNSSVVIKLEYGDFSVLFCGDIEKEAEEDILQSGAEISADVIKIAHHGSKSSSTQEFLEAVNANFAVISTGEDKNKLPKKSVLERIESLGAEIYRTDIDGYIICSYDGENIIFDTEK